MIELPDFGAARVVQSALKPSKRDFDSLDQLTIVVPKDVTAAQLRALPQGAQLAALHARAKSKDEMVLTSRMSTSHATRVIAAALPVKDSFGTLTWARKLIAQSLQENPVRLGLMTSGLTGADRERALRALVAAALAAALDMPTFKSDKKHKSPKLRSLHVFGAPVVLEDLRAQALGNDIARWLTALPPNILTAAAYREAATQLGKAHSLTAEFLGEKKLETLGAGAFLAVAQGNEQRDAGILRLKYRPGKETRPEVALVGKGIIFDTGGTNLKPFKGMLDMHTDMQGSAVALGTGIALAELEVPFAFDVWMAITENRISGRAYKSQDVVTAANGTTIQVIHTDAEGRMVLADTLALAAREEPKLIIDYATLTGSCVGALTERYTGVFSNRASAYPVLTKAGADSGERVWPFPMDDDFDESLRSDVADIKQCSPEGSGDHILAARFLSRFVPRKIPWIHLDLSAGQHKEGLAHIPTEITGFGVRYTLELLQKQAGSPRELIERLAASGR
ncbi:MAG TPA: leucyl aminopeptidase family protein [Gammaproteobacteria bacterium]|jgi:leucyl aminopeptidase